jgi:hypothetical protein
MIEFISPKPRATIGKGDGISFTVDDTYTALQIHVEISDALVLAYDATVGPSAGYQVDVTPSDSTHVYTITRDAGWLHSPTIIQVTENEDTEVHITVFSYDLPGVVKFPRLVNPKATSFAKLRISEDDGTPIEDVEHIDLVNANSSPDGLRGTSDEEKVGIISAVATTNDPDALHVNVANEISGIAELSPPTSVRSDWMIIEDSAAAGVKKKALVEKVIPAPIPSHLENDLGCQLLYVHDSEDDDWYTTGPISSARFDPLPEVDNAFHRILMDGVTGTNEGVKAFGSNTDCSSAALTTADLSTLNAGECTVQWYGTGLRGLEAMRTYGVLLFALQGQNANANKITWSLLLEPGRDNYEYIPAFRWHNTANTVIYTIKDTAFAMAPYEKIHIAGIRTDQGGGLWTGALWVNGLKVAETTDLPPAFATTEGDMSKLMHITDSAGLGVDRIQIYGTKYSNIAMSDAQITSEYKKALGYP